MVAAPCVPLRLARTFLLGALVCLSQLKVCEPAMAGSAFVGGINLSCAIAKVYVDKRVPGPGFSLPGTVLLGSSYLKAYPPIVQRLVFLHECGHQYVGTDENAADCWAVRTGKRQGWLTLAGLAQACKAIWHTQSDGAHLAGPERCAELRQCYNQAPALGKGE
jgi:hypothetical protein